MTENLHQNICHKLDESGFHLSHSASLICAWKRSGASPILCKTSQTRTRIPDERSVTWSLSYSTSTLNRLLLL